MAEIKEAFHANETKVVALLSTNLGFFLEGLHVDTGCSLEEQSLLNSPHLTCAHRTHALLCCLDEDASGQGYERLLRLIEERSKDDSTFRTVAADVRAFVGRVNPAYIVKGPPGDAPGSKLPPHLLGFVLCWEQPRIRTLLGVSWLQAMPALSELGLMAPALRRRLVKRNCTSDEKAAMILDQLASFPDSPAAVLTLLRRLSLNDSAAGVLLQSMDVKLRSLLEEKVAGVLDRRIRRVLFPSATCWPKKICMVDIFEDFHAQEFYCKVWRQARSGEHNRASDAISTGNLSSAMCDSDVRMFLSEAIVTEYQVQSDYLVLQEAINQMSACRNQNFLLARLHRRMIGYYFFKEQNFAQAYHHLFRAYEICCQLEPDECTTRVISSWGTYMNMIGDYAEARKAFSVAVEQIDRVAQWMRPLTEGVKLDKAQFHVCRAVLSREAGSVQEGDSEIEEALMALKFTDYSLLPASHKSAMKYVQAQICRYNGNALAATKFAQEGADLFGAHRAPLYLKLVEFIGSVKS